MSLKVKLVSLITLCMLMFATLIVGVLAVNQTINLQGIVDFNVAEKSLYIKSASLQDGVDGEEQPLPNFLPGYVNKEFNLNLGKVQNTSGLLIIYLDMINTTTSRYDIGVKYTGAETVSVSTTGTIAAGTGDPVSDSSTTSRVSISISTLASEINLDDVTVTLEKIVYVYTGFTFNVNDTDDTASLVRYNGSDTEVIIPSTISTRVNSETGETEYIEGSDYTVTSIADGSSSTTGAFYQARNTLQSVIIPEKITSIGNYAFTSCINLVNVMFMNNSLLENLGNVVFSTCYNLTSITIPANVTNIGTSAFWNCYALAEVYNYSQDFTFKAGVSGTGSLGLYAKVVHNLETGDKKPTSRIRTDIGDNKVQYYDDGTQVIALAPSVLRNSLITVELDNSTTEINQRAFYECSNLTSVVIPNNTTSIGAYVFYRCSNLESVDFEANSQLTSIGNNAFQSCSNLSSVDFGDNSQLTSIEAGAFLYCSSLTSITIPEGITNIADATFQDCSSLKNIVFRSNNQLLSIGGYAFSGCSSFTNLTIPESVTSIRNYAFNGCSSFTNLTIPESVTSISGSAFRGCTGLIEINYNAKEVTDFNASNNYVFYNAGQNGEGITVTFGPEVTKIPNYLFYPSSNSSYHPKIITVNISESVTNMGKYAFQGCTELTNIYYNAKNVEDSNSYAFSKAGKEGAEVTFGSAVTKIPTYLFSNSNITTVIFENNSQLTSIRDYAFSGCSSLTSINFGDNSHLANIDYGAFSGCTFLESVNFGANSLLTSIGSSAFNGCSSLTSITIPEGVISIGREAFNGCTGLIEINYNAKEVADFSGTSDRVFYNAGTDGNGITVTFGSEVTKIPAFIFCYGSNSDPNIIKIEFVDNNQLTSIGNSAFYFCSQITSIDFGYNCQLTNIGAQAFSDCTSLKEIVIPESLTTIGNYAFYHCTSLASINIGDSNLTSIGNNAFQSCTSLTSITIPEGVTSIGNSAFQSCSNLSSVDFGDNSQLTSIGVSAFWGCSNLASITIPASVTYIGRSAFTNCSNLSNVDFINELGWYRTTSSTANSGTNMDVSNNETNAANLRLLYNDYYWKRNA